MKKDSLKTGRKKRNEKPQFVAFGKDINGIVATAAIVILLLIAAIILVVVLASVLQAE